MTDQQTDHESTVETIAELPAVEAFALQVVEEIIQGEAQGDVPGDVMEDDDSADTEVGPLQRLCVPINYMQAALTCSSTEETRHYLNGVFLHSVDDMVRIVATDGHRLFIGAFRPELGDDEALPDWLAKGVIVHNERLAPKLAMAAKFGESSVGVLTYGKNAPHVLLSDMRDEATFRCYPVDAAFPDYQRIVDEVGGITDDADSRPKDFDAVSFQGRYLKAAGDLAKILVGKDGSVSVFAGAPERPALMTFPGATGALLILMPLVDKGPDADTRALLAPAMSRSIAALRAHQTRNEEWASGAATEAERATFTAKASEYEQRVADLIAKANGQSALPAPDAPTEPELIDGEPLAAGPGEGSDVTEAGGETEGPEEVAEVETPAAPAKTRSKKQQKKAHRKTHQPDRAAA